MKNPDVQKTVYAIVKMLGIALIIISIPFILWALLHLTTGDYYERQEIYPISTGEYLFCNSTGNNTVYNSDTYYYFYTESDGTVLNKINPRTTHVITDTDGEAYIIVSGRKSLWGDAIVHPNTEIHLPKNAIATSACSWEVKDYE